jgi:hypothetical protein
MSATLDLVTDLIRPDRDGTPPHEPTYTAGLSDALGDRLICFTDPGATSLELLRFKPELGDAAGFESALRASVEALGRLDPAFATVRAVERIEEISGLALASVRESGRRLSDLVPRARGTAHAVELVREIGPALALLQEAGHAHGALTPERVIVSREGRLIVLEHVLGAALGALGLPAVRLRAIAGVAVPDAGDGPVAIDARLDVIQLGFMALSLIAGQRLPASAYPSRVTKLLDEYSDADPAAAAAFRPWLERALQTGDRPFADASEALAAFRDLPESLFPKAGDVPTAWPAPPVAETAVPAATLAPAGKQESEPEADPAPVLASGPDYTAHKGSSDTTTLRRALAILGVIVVAQAAIIALLLLSGRSSDPASAAGSPPVSAEAGVDPFLGSAGVGEPTDGTNGDGDTSPPQPQRADGRAAAPPAATDTPATAVTPEPVAPPIEPGRVTIAAPIELQIFEDGSLLGSTVDPVSLTPGRHTLDVVNDELGFRATQTVTVRAGRTSTVTIAVPTGRIDINAVPWADVWIDGTAAGQTPLANLSLPIGRHEILFRHPQLGEKLEIAIVRVEGIARVSAVFQQ